jgi:predicted transcriptional regulator
MASGRSAAGRALRTVLVVAICAVAAYLALNAIPSAERPHLVRPAHSSATPQTKR